VMLDVALRMIGLLKLRTIAMTTVVAQVAAAPKVYAFSLLRYSFYKYNYKN